MGDSQVAAMGRRAGLIRVDTGVGVPTTRVGVEVGVPTTRVEVGVGVPITRVGVGIVAHTTRVAMEVGIRTVPVVLDTAVVIRTTRVGMDPARLSILTSVLASIRSQSMTIPAGFPSTALLAPSAVSSVKASPPVTIPTTIPRLRPTW